MTVIQIEGQPWTLGGRLDRGGFGEVFGASNGEQHGVIKLVPKAAGGKRELLFADDLRGLPGVVPVLGVGETEDAWALLMPRAQHSLRTYLKVTGRLDHEEAFPILVDIADALVHLAERGVVHRDLKPENILMLSGVWCLSDFGISRYAEATTETETRKGRTTRPYNAPEQWREERATSAADVYAWGIICHELLSGARPFNGPDDRFREQHLHEDPPSLTDVPPSLAALVRQCLSKPPGARPSPESLARRLTKIVTERPTSDGLTALRAATSVAATRQGSQQTRESIRQSDAERREDYIKTARRQLEDIREELLEAIASEAGIEITGFISRWEELARHERFGAIPEPPRQTKQLRLGGACLQVAATLRSPLAYRQPWVLNGARPLFDVVAFADITVGSRAGSNRYAGREHSLWYGDIKHEGEYGWFEVAFIDDEHFKEPLAPFPKDDVSPIQTQDTRLLSDDRYRGSYAPFSTGLGLPKPREFNNDAVDAALRGHPERYHLAWPFTPLVAGELDEFIDRWASWFAAAAQGRLKRPKHYPERDPSDSWRGAPSAQETKEPREPDAPAEVAFQSLSDIVLNHIIAARHDATRPDAPPTLDIPPPRQLPPPNKKGWRSRLFGG